MRLDEESAGGMRISRSGFLKRDDTWAACSVRGVSARFFIGRVVRGSEEVGMDSGMFSDIAVVVGVVVMRKVLHRTRGGRVEESGEVEDGFEFVGDTCHLDCTS